MLDAELQNRRDNVLQHRLRDARFPEVKTLDSFEFAAQPSVDRGLVLTLAKGQFTATASASAMWGIQERASPIWRGCGLRYGVRHLHRPPCF